MATYKFNNGIKTERVTTNSASSGSNNNGLDLTVSTGSGDGTGNGGDIILDTGVSTGSGNQGSITFNALGSAMPIPFNEIGDVDLIPQFTATSVIGALNELKNPLVLPVEQSFYSDTMDLNYNDTNFQDIPGFIDVIAGNWLINFSFVVTTSSPNVSVIIVVRDGSNNIIENSKTFITSNSSTNRYPVSKHFIYTEGNATNNLKISYALDGLGTNAAVEMQPLIGFDNPDQIPILWGSEITSSFDNFNYTGTDINYNGTTIQDIGAGTISLTAGDWLIGYNITLTTPTTIDSPLVFIRDTSNNIIGQSQSLITKNTTQNRINISKTFILSIGAPTDYKLSFVLDSTAAVNAAVEMDVLSNFAGNDQVPNLWAINLSVFDNFQQDIYSTTTDINYNGTTAVDATSTITLSKGYWLVGYSLVLNAPISNDSPIIFIRDSFSNVVELSKYFVSPVNNSSRYTVSKSFFFTQTADTEDLKLSFRLNTAADLTTAVQMTGFSTSVPIQRPSIWAIRVGDLTGTSFLDLFDTPSSYVGQTNSVVTVNQTETGLNFRSLNAGTAISIVSTPTNFTINSDAFNSVDNVGAGTGTIGIDNGNELQMKTIITSGALSLTNNANDITLNSDGFNSVDNIGAGTGTIGIDNINELQLKTLVAGTNIGITNNPDNIEIGVTHQYVYEMFSFQYTDTIPNSTTTLIMVTSGLSNASGIGMGSYGYCIPYACTLYKFTMTINGADEFSDGSINTRLYNNGNNSTPIYETGAINNSLFIQPMNPVPSTLQVSASWISGDLNISLVGNDIVYCNATAVITLDKPEGLFVNFYTRRLVAIP